jgi:hypothetical protein
MKNTAIVSSAYQTREAVSVPDLNAEPRFPEFSDCPTAYRCSFSYRKAEAFEAATYCALQLHGRP